MSWNPDIAFVQNYRSDLELKFQQMGSRLRKTVRNAVQRAEYEYFDRLGTATANDMTTRHADTPLDDIDHSRRRNQIIGANHALLFDNQDKLKMLIDPTSGYAQSQAAALGRKMDSRIITAASGTAYAGKSGGTATVYNTAYRIASTYTESGAVTASNLPIGKLRQARYLLDSGEAVADGETIWFIHTAKQTQSLLRSTEVTSSDYNTVKALVAGEINSFMGFNFVRTELLSKSSNDRTCLAYPTSALVLGVGQDIKVEITPRADKNYSIQVYSENTCGATRLWEEKVIEVICDESV